MRFGIDRFGGEIPKLEPHLLPDIAAQTAENVKIISRGLRAWRKPSLVFTPSVAGTLQSMYRMYNGATDYWLTWKDDVDAVKGPVAGDTTFRLYYTGDTAGQGWPKKTNLALAIGAGDYPHDYLELGVPAPDTAPSVGHSGGAGAAQSRTYVTTFVTTWGEESAPSAATTAIGKVDDTWTVTGDASVAGPSTKYDITLKRIYRAYTNAANQTNYYFLVEQALAAGAYTDATTDAVLVTQGILPTYIFGVVGSEWSVPPTDLKGLCIGANGIMAGFSKNTVCFSEPFFPHAWPTRYRKALPWDIVCVLPFGNSFVIGTKGRPYVISGKHPSAMSQEQISRDDMPCISKRGSVGSDAGPVLVTPNGLALIGTADPAHVTEAFMDKDKWQAKCFPATLIARSWNAKYVGFFDSGSGKKGVLLDRNNQDGPLTFLNQNVTGAYTDPESNKLYMLQDNKIYEFDGDLLNDSVYDWKSKIFSFSKPWNPGAFKIDADFSVISGDVLAEAAQTVVDQDNNVAISAALPAETYPGPATIQDAIGSHILGGYYLVSATDDLAAGPGPNGSGIHVGGSLLVGGAFAQFDARTINFELWAMDDATSTMTLKHTESITDRDVHSLPGDYMSDRFHVRASGNIPITAIKVASTPKQLEQI